MAKIDEIRNKFKNLTTLNDIRNFLIDRSKRHKAYYHYTNVDALEGMLKSKTLYLSNVSRMNDLLEPLNIPTKKWGNIYIASFSFSSHESVALWSLYGNPLNKAIRIQFTQSSIQRAINNINDKKQCSNIDNSETYKIKNINLVDITYLNEKADSIRWNRALLSYIKCPEINNISKHAEMAGFVKNIAWEYETEVRIIVELAAKHKNPPKQIKIDATPLWKSAKILCGPYLEKEKFINDMNSFYKNHPDAITLDFKKHNTVENSFLLNKLVLKTKCEHCNKKEDCDTYNNKS